MKRILVACEYSGTVRDAFAAKGWEAWSCDLLPSDKPGLHYEGNVTHLLNGWVPVRYSGQCDPDGDNFCSFTQNCTADCPCLGPTQDDVEYMETESGLFARPANHPHWDLMVAHPPCTYLSVSGMHWTARGLRDPQLTEDALGFVRLLMDAPIRRIAIENPVSVISSRIRKPDQTIQPWQFGHDASKATCLWLKDLPALKPTAIVEPRIVNGKKRWANQTDGGQNKLLPSKDRWKIRSATYQGIADAMAEQWSNLP